MVKHVDDDSDDEETRGPVDPEALALATQISRLAVQAGISRRALSKRAGLDPTQVSHYLNGKRGMAVERIIRLARAAGATLIVDAEATLPFATSGIIDDKGVIKNHEEGPLSLPTYLELSGQAGPFQAGDRACVEPHTQWSEGRWLLVHLSGQRRLMHATRRQNLQFLSTTDGDLVLYEPARHTIEGLVVRRVREDAM